MLLSGSATLRLRDSVGQGGSALLSTGLSLFLIAYWLWCFRTGAVELGGVVDLRIDIAYVT